MCVHEAATTKDHFLFHTMEDFGIVSGGDEDSSYQDDDETVNHEETTLSRPPRRRSTMSTSSTTPKRTYVKHNYHDHSLDPIGSNGGDDQDAVDAKRGPRRGPRGGVVIPFPEKLYYMLDQVEKDDLEDVVSWQPHGRCFVVHDPKRMVDEVLPRYFRQSKLTSFQRQVNLYGFCRLTQGKDRGAYYHELFLRGRPDLYKRLVRIRVKGTGFKSAASPSTEPDFYKMPFCMESNSPVHNSVPMATAELEALDMADNSSFLEAALQPVKSSDVTPSFKPLASPGALPFVMGESHQSIEDPMSLCSLVSAQGVYMSTFHQSDYMSSTVNGICPVTPDESQSSSTLRRLPPMMQHAMPSLPVLKGEKMMVNPNEGFSPLPLMPMVMTDVNQILKEDIEDFPCTTPVVLEATVPLSVQQQNHVLLGSDPFMDESCDPLLLLDEVVSSA